ncbi:uncharacterized protein BO80DRAFT_163472 [Aspergillus ibericus CBS 121593]|uniref:Transmembrane protein n=1 Tax=Aspergillus ibericus CBS 121593 TaxID=1448316 RepID=A0A395GRY8_9EURO|nr:hypothetical protein BO80DRAFT_163472 [Aspergillus ibericus CBS 121593]RAK98199.1 hypothetical protein BO80DRAFT_163472 [Aspergillus ibericus CBS 121593]
MAHDRRAGLEGFAPFQPLAEAALVPIRMLRARRSPKKRHADGFSFHCNSQLLFHLSTFPSASSSSSSSFSTTPSTLRFPSFLPFYLLVPSSLLLFLLFSPFDCFWSAIPRP